MFIENALADTDTITIQDSTPELDEGSINTEAEFNWSSLFPMILIFFVFYFLLIRPQEKKRRQQEELISGVKTGEEVVTHSGLFGIVQKINDTDNTIIIEIAKDVEVKILKNAVSDIISRNKKTTKDKKESKKQQRQKLK